jgi:phosphoglycolate phosphatase-like HAD superfamily hydrolase
MQEKNRAAVFDLDGTLLDSGITFHRIVNELKNKPRDC